MTITKDNLSKNAMGGTELMKHALVEHLGKDYLKDFQIFVSRIEEEYDEDKIRIFWAHDLPGDPANKPLTKVEDKNGNEIDGWKNFHKIVFNSNWQMQAYINQFKIPWSHCIVLQNAIEPIPFNEEKWEPEAVKDKIKLIYTPTPHRGLVILSSVFERIAKDFDNVELDVYSSFKLYGWEERDKAFEQLFDQLKNQERVNYHGSVPNEQIREALQEAHILAYPSIWMETSCLCLMEAMSAGLVCVHSNYGALPETAANWTHMYHYHENPNQHASVFYGILRTAIEDAMEQPEFVRDRLRTQKSYADVFYGWANRKLQWKMLLDNLKANVEDRSLPEKEAEVFEYVAGA